ncbi:MULTISPECIES: PAS domain S-box protein [Haloferax]|uniref:histidine kinase n=2 Tax=Haloferax TaxID=2251 RepID=A0A6G1YZD6_9EURY|nr:MULTISPECIES: PAS domain S-box protein [Haloferax]KAB1186870.1 PAS domain S-box protein [Haloferax sp. CBA1149]MRW79501.1 PAS domain S-box protein [Haloferax marinisediminis]
MDFGNVSSADAPIRVLLVDDERAFAATTAEGLRTHGEMDVVSVCSPSAALDRLSTSSVDCVVSEYAFDETTGIDFLRTVRESHPALPFILFTRHGSETVASDAISAGVTDYVKNGQNESNESVAALVDRIEAAVAASPLPADGTGLRQWYEAIVEQSPVGLYLVHDGFLVYANDYFLTLLGCGASDAIGQPLADLVAESDRQLVEDRLGPGTYDSLDSVTYTIDAETKDGRPISMETTGRHVSLGGDDIVVGAATDITARLASEREIRRSEPITRQIISSLPDMVFLSEPDAFDIVYINDTFEQVWGRSQKTLYEDPMSFLDLVHVDDRDRLERGIRALFADIEAGTADDRYEFEFRFVPEASETVRWAAARAVPLFDEDGSITNVLGVMTDLTERIRREQELAKQNDRLEAFARVLSHDIRGPLAVAQGRLDLARETGDQSHLDHVERAHSRITEVVEDVLSMACDERAAMDLSEVALADSAAAAWEMCVSDTDTVRLELDELPVVEADKSRMKRFFENLFRNAIQHATTDDDAELVIRVGTLPSRRGFFVEDDGRGIPRSMRDTIFETGVSTKEDGAHGFGLGIVRQIVHTHGWLVRIGESDAGGARFEVLFDTVGDANTTS